MSSTRANVLPPEQALHPDDFRSVLASAPTPLTSVAALINGEPVGMIVGSFVGLSLEPALVAVSIQKTSSTWPLLREADYLGISVLTTDHAGVVRELAGPRSQRFQNVNWCQDRGAVLLDGSGTHLTGRIVNEVETGDHLLVVLEVDNVRQGPCQGPLVFHGSCLSAIEPLDGEAK